jgi:DNA-binding FrmR family transcriptional regulator
MVPVGDEMAHTVKGKKALVTRVRRIKGQTEALERALDQEVECNAVLQQITAIRGAINGLLVEVLEGHIRDHLGPDVEDVKQREEDLEQLLRVMRSYMR